MKRHPRSHRCSWLLLTVRSHEAQVCGFWFSFSLEQIQELAVAFDPKRCSSFQLRNHRTHTVAPLVSVCSPKLWHPKTHGCPSEMITALSVTIWRHLHYHEIPWIYLKQPGPWIHLIIASVLGISNYNRYTQITQLPLLSTPFGWASGAIVELLITSNYMD